MENDQPTLDNARRLRGIYSVDPRDQDYYETLSKIEKKIGKTCGRSHAVQKVDSFQHQGTGRGVECISQGSKKRSMVE